MCLMKYIDYLKNSSLVALNSIKNEKLTKTYLRKENAID